MVSTLITLNTTWTKLVDDGTDFTLMVKSGEPVLISYSTGAPTDDTTALSIPVNAGWTSAYGQGEVWGKAQTHSANIILIN